MSSTQQDIAIVWFREDLRLHDNLALDYALNHHQAILPVYIYAPDELGQWAMGGASRWWLHHSLINLEQNLRKLGAKLCLRQGSSSLSELITLTNEITPSAIYWNRLYDPVTICRDQKIQTALQDFNMVVRCFCGNLIYEPDVVLKPDQTHYRVFTAFWKKYRERGIEHCSPSQPQKINAPKQMPRTLPLKKLSLLPRLAWDQEFYPHWQPGETGALKCIEQFFSQSLANYAQQRDQPSAKATSRLSAHLHFGEISIHRIIAMALAQAPGCDQAVERLLAQIGWREFAIYTLYHAPHTLDTPLDQRFIDFPWRDDQEALQRWQQGKTGFPIIDAGMHELKHTGWMHNRVRMLVASFLSKNLLIDWRLGARWFWDQLVDADLANNTLGWQWVAGCGTDAAPYFRIFNPVKQSQRFDLEGQYIKRWLPPLRGLDNTMIHTPWLANLADYPKPLVDLQATRIKALQAFRELKANHF